MTSAHCLDESLSWCRLSPTQEIPMLNAAGRGSLGFKWNCKAKERAFRASSIYRLAREKLVRNEDVHLAHQ